MFDKHLFVHMTEDHSVQAANILARSNDRLGDRLNDISQKELKARDRVDISLEEYEQLKNEVTSLRYENASLKSIFTRIGIPIKVINYILPNTVAVRKSEDLKDFVTHYYIAFDTNDIWREML